MTSDGDALFRALCESPNDDTPRLVYADWLEESGDPDRAEFIRLQCERWNLCPAYPTVTEARTRATQLLRAHRDRWDAELQTAIGLTWGEMYVRGFIDTARIAGASYMFAALDAIFAATPIHHLYVGELAQGQLAQLLADPRLGRLTRLRLPGLSGRSEGRLVIEAQARFPNTEIV
jgi:uncharacterized protein (TIGR02996 family)